MSDERGAGSADGADERAEPAAAGTPADEAPVEVTPAPVAESGAAASAAEVDAAALKDRWLRAEADLQNYRRRAAREREEARRSAEEGVMLEVVAALDDLDRALATARESGAPESWTEGVRLVASRLTDYLARQGVVALDPVGHPFDPAFHEAILEAGMPGVRPGDVAQVVLKGWRRGERVLRAARVVVARAPEPAPETGE